MYGFSETNIGGAYAELFKIDCKDNDKVKSATFTFHITMSTWEYDQLVYSYADCDGNDTAKQIKENRVDNPDETTTVSLTLNDNASVTQLAFLGPEGGYGYRSLSTGRSWMY